MIRLAFLLALITTPALAFTASNGIPVLANSAATFTVPSRFSPDLSDFWCAAGDYTIRVLGKPADTRIWRTTPLQRHAGQAIDFSLIEVKGAKTGFLPIGFDDGSLSAVMAQSFCTVTDRD